MNGRATVELVTALEAAVAEAAAAGEPAQAARRILYVAYSGGADSTALLLAAAASRARLAGECRAFHFDHRLHPDSGNWAEHCRARCAALDVPLRIVSAADTPPAGSSVEAWARDRRYAAAAALLGPGDFLLTAHHRDDLAETVLLAALRGSGPHGLAGIAPRRALGAGTLLRPLLALPRATLRAAVSEAGVDCVEDPANADPRHDRSYLRRVVMPLLDARFPAASANLGRVASLQRAAAVRLDADADATLARLGATDTRLPLGELGAWAQDRSTAVLRRWLVRASGHAPDARLLARLWRDLVHAREDASPLIDWRGGELRRYRATLYWLSRPAQALAQAYVWAPGATLELPGGLLSARPTTGRGLRASLAQAGLSVRPRRGGETLLPAGRAHTVSVKQLFQQHGVPPWERAQLPLVWAGEQLVAVADLCVAAEAAAGPGESGFELVYRR